jgi:hypothetical protein
VNCPTLASFETVGGASSTFMPAGGMLGFDAKSGFSRGA